MTAIFKGSTAACVVHLRDAIQDDYLAKRHIVATFVGVDDQTVRRWFAGDSKPKGGQLIKLRFYLEFLGYHVEELQPLDSVVRNVGRMFAFGAIPLEEVTHAVGYPEGQGGNDAVLRVLRGARGIMSDKADRFASLVDQYGDQLAERKRQTQKIQLQSGLPETPGPELPPTPLPVRLSPSLQPQSTDDAIIEALAASVRAMIPLARAMGSDAFTPEHRARVRELAGGDGVFTLANSLYRLCSERSRKMR